MLTGKTSSLLIAQLTAAAAYAGMGYSESASVVPPRNRTNAAARIVRVYDVRRLLEKYTRSPPVEQVQLGYVINIDPNYRPQYRIHPISLDSDVDWGQELITAVEEHIDPISWTNNGGSCNGGSMKHAAGMLIVEHSAEVQKQVADFLHHLDGVD